MSKTGPGYTYNGTIVRWVDGDTVDLTVDLGFYMTVTARFRSFGVDTPERGKPGYGEATARVNQLAPPGSSVRVETYKAVAGKYGRFLATIWRDDININQTLVDEGLAREYFGGHKQ